MLASIRKLNIAINPQTSAYIAAFFTLVGLLATASPSIFPTYLPHNWVTNIIQTAGCVTFFWNGMQMTLHLFSSTQPGPWAPQDQPSVTVQKASYMHTLAWLAVFIGASLFLLVAALPTSAATLHVTKCGRSGCEPPAPWANVTPTPVPAASSGTAGSLNSLGDWATGDVDEAIAAATKYPDVQDEVGKACFVDLKTVAAMIKDHPFPLTLKVATDIEYARLIQGKLNQLCRDPACAQVWADMASNAKALEIVPLPLNFASICSRVPVVGLSLPTPAPTPTPAPAK